jgi:glutamate dehydrogenase/leucine dehydrogenase
MQAGYKIVGLADIGGRLYNDNGFDVEVMIESTKKPLQDFPDSGTR